MVEEQTPCLLKNAEQKRRLAPRAGPALEVRGRSDVVVLSWTLPFCEVIFLLMGTASTNWTLLQT